MQNNGFIFLNKESWDSSHIMTYAWVFKSYYKFLIYGQVRLLDLCTDMYDLLSDLKELYNLYVGHQKEYYLFFSPFLKPKRKLLIKGKCKVILFFFPQGM